VQIKIKSEILDKAPIKVMAQAIKRRANETKNLMRSCLISFRHSPQCPDFMEFSRNWALQNSHVRAQRGGLYECIVLTNIVFV
jgi:hypothetical protein